VSRPPPAGRQSSFPSRFLADITARSGLRLSREFPPCHPPVFVSDARVVLGEAPDDVARGRAAADDVLSESAVHPAAPSAAVASVVDAGARGRARGRAARAAGVPRILGRAHATAEGVLRCQRRQRDPQPDLRPPRGARSGRHRR